MADQQTPQQLAENMIPGLPAVNWLRQLFSGAPMVDPRVQQQADAQNAARIRTRIAIANERLRAGQRVLSPDEMDAEVRRRLMPAHLQPAVPTAP